MKAKTPLHLYIDAFARMTDLQQPGKTKEKVYEFKVMLAKQEHHVATQYYLARIEVLKALKDETKEETIEYVLAIATLEQCLKQIDTMQKEMLEVFAKEKEK